MEPLHVSDPSPLPAPRVRPAVTDPVTALDAIDPSPPSPSRVRPTVTDPTTILNAIGVEPGWHTSADLYLRYVQACHCTDGPAPVSREQFGASLRRVGWRSMTRSTPVGRFRSWLVPGRAELTAERLADVLDDMGAKPGWHASASLYRWYEGMCQEDGLVPISRQEFGVSLRRMGYRMMSRVIPGDVAKGRCWFIPHKAFHGAEVDCPELP